MKEAFLMIFREIEVEKLLAWTRETCCQYSWSFFYLDPSCLLGSCRVFFASNVQSLESPRERGNAHANLKIVLKMLTHFFMSQITMVAIESF